MKKRTKFIICVITISIVVSLFLLFQESNEIHYNTRALALESLLAEKNNVLETITIDNREVIFIYNKYNEAIFIATIRRIENGTKFIVEHRTSAWKIGGVPSPMINGEYNVGAKNITFYAWKDSDKLKSLINENKIINRNKNRINKYEQEVYLLILIDTISTETE